MTKRRMEIEAALVWAFREELPKAAPAGRPEYFPGPQAPGGGGTERATATWGTLPDNLYGVVFDPASMGEPHGDALAIHAAVMALDDGLAPDFPADWSGFAPELVGLGSAAQVAIGRMLTAIGPMGPAAGAGVMWRRPSDIVRTAAILGAPSGWEIDVPVVRDVADDRGQTRWFRRVVLEGARGTGYEVEVDGFDHKARRPYGDAYRKTVLDPDPIDALVARARWQVWRAALDVLVEDLAGALAEVEVTASDRSWAPWSDGVGGARRLPDLAADAWRQVRPADTRPKRRRGRVKWVADGLAETS